MTQAELSAVLDTPHSTVAARLRRAGVAVQGYEGERALYLAPVALRILLVLEPL